MAMRMKVNLHYKHEPKSHVAVYLYNSDKVLFEAKAKALGLSTSDMLRTLVNSVLDGALEVEV